MSTGSNELAVVRDRKVHGPVRAPPPTFSLPSRPGRCLSGTGCRDSSHSVAVESAWKGRHSVEDGRLRDGSLPLIPRPDRDGMDVWSYWPLAAATSRFSGSRILVGSAHHSVETSEASAANSPDIVNKTLDATASGCMHRRAYLPLIPPRGILDTNRPPV